MDLLPKTADQIALEHELAFTFTSARATDRWLESPSPILGGERPSDCLKRREYDRVRAALEALNTGVYI